MADTALMADIRAAINRNSAENGSNTPDHILGLFLLRVLDAFDSAVNDREIWYGRSAAGSKKGEPA